MDEPKQGGCPCLYTTPCSKHCTCANPVMSGGCRRCARYGSIEQRTAAAKHLAQKLDVEPPTAKLPNLLEILNSVGLTLAAAESLTAGYVQSLISATPGISKFFRGGVTAYTLEAKVQLLGVDWTSAAAVNCVSQDVAIEMARGVTRMFECDLGVATTGYATPDPDHGILAPCAHWAIWNQKEGKAVANGFLEAPKDMPRIDFQKLVAQNVYVALGVYLTQS